MLLAAALALCSAVVVIGPAAYLRHATARHRYLVSSAPDAPVAIVLGAGVHGGQPSPFLARRLDLAVELFASGRVRGLLTTGDNSRSDYDEVGVMASYAVAHGVPAEVIGQDHAGFDTYDSCYRARAIFGVRRAIVVTQSFHTARAVFVCRHLGVDAAGVGDDTSRNWPGPTRRAQVRELFSSVKALWETEVSHPEPHFLGPHETALDAVMAGEGWRRVAHVGDAAAGRPPSTMWTTPGDESHACKTPAHCRVFSATGWRARNRWR